MLGMFVCLLFIYVITFQRLILVERHWFVKRKTNTQSQTFSDYRENE